MEPTVGNRNDLLLTRYLKKGSNDVICVFLKLSSVLFLTLLLWCTSSKIKKKKQGNCKFQNIYCHPTSINQSESARTLLSPSCRRRPASRPCQRNCVSWSPWRPLVLRPACRQKEEKDTPQLGIKRLPTPSTEPEYPPATDPKITHPGWMSLLPEPLLRLRLH